MEKTDEIIIASKQRPFWQLILAAFLYTITILCFWNGYFRMKHPNLYSRDEYRGSVILMEIAIFPLLFAVFYSINLKIEIVPKSKEIREIYNIGFVKFSYKSKIKNLNYISVFFKADIEKYILMLWYKENKHETLCGFKDFDSAMTYGKNIAKQLEIDLLDATEKGNFKWVEKDKI